MAAQSRAKRMRIGWAVAFVLAVLTALEYWFAVEYAGSPLVPLAIIAIIKAYLIIQFFMHISQLWHREEGH